MLQYHPFFFPGYPFFFNIYVFNENFNIIQIICVSKHILSSYKDVPVTMKIEDSMSQKSLEIPQTNINIIGKKVLIEDIENNHHFLIVCNRLCYNYI